MNLFVKGLSPHTQILIAMGSAMAAGCRPCLNKLVGLAKGEGLDEAEMRAAVTIGQFVKDEPAREMKALAHELLGGDPAGNAADIDCLCGAEETAKASCCG